jgi:tetratricopeptide (TPR) repeat protein
MADMIGVNPTPPAPRRPIRRAPRPSLAPIGLGMIVVLVGARPRAASGQVPDHADRSVGTVHFAVSCSAAAQVEFDRAVALLHHMTYPQARAAFTGVATTDPHCAMAYWGIAMTLFQPLWPTRPGPDALARGWAAVEQARAQQPRTERERLFVAAAEAFFLDPGSTDYWLRIRRWEQAMERVYTAFPDDDEAAAFYALASLATAPPGDPAVARAHADSAAAILLRVYQHNPDHPGAMHYLVHANDAPGREGDELEITRRYETLAPDNPHALHMPTHIYTRLGDWDGVIRGNLRAADAALKYPAGEHGELVSDEFPHALEYLIYAYLQVGADDSASAQIQRLLATAALEPTFKTAFHLASTRARYALERHDWDAALHLVPREPAVVNWDRFAWPEAITWFARGLGAAHLARTDVARAALARLDALDSVSRNGGEVLFTRNIQMLKLELSAWLEHANGQEDTSAALMRDAARLEASTPKHAVTPGPTLPADELLGDLLMEQHQPVAALAAYRQALARYPRRFNGLLGAARAARALGDPSLARTFYGGLVDVAGGGTRQPELREARDYLSPGSRRQPPPAIPRPATMSTRR